MRTTPAAPAESPTAEPTPAPVEDDDSVLEMFLNSGMYSDRELPGRPDFTDTIHACGHRRRKPRLLCVSVLASEADDPALPFLPAIRKRAVRRRVSEDGEELEIRPRALEAATNGVLHNEVEHQTAGLGDCTWRLRRRVDDSYLFDPLPLFLCRN